MITVLRQAHQAVEDAGREGSPPSMRACWLASGNVTTSAVALGIVHNRLRDWDGDGNHPGYALGLREHAEQVWLFTTAFEVEWTSNSAERAAKAPSATRPWPTQDPLGRWCRIRRYRDSAANHGFTALDAVTTALAGNRGYQPQPAIPAARAENPRSRPPATWPPATLPPA